jgi:hypothetical protein
VRPGIGQAVLFRIRKQGSAKSGFDRYKHAGFLSSHKAFEDPKERGLQPIKKRASWQEVVGGAEAEEAEEGVAGDDLMVRLMAAMSQERSLRSVQRWVSP